MMRLELRRGAHVRYSPAHTDEWRDGELVRASVTGEEWLVKNRYGRYWINVSRLRPPEDDTQPDAA